MQRPPFDSARGEDGLTAIIANSTLQNLTAVASPSMGNDRRRTVAGSSAKRCVAPDKDADNFPPLQAVSFRPDEHVVPSNLLPRTAFGRVIAPCRDPFMRWHVNGCPARQGSHTESMGRESRAYGSCLLARSNRWGLPVVPTEAPVLNDRGPAVPQRRERSTRPSDRGTS